MHRLLDHIDHIFFGGFTILEWLGIAALIVLSGIVLFLVAQRLFGIAVEWKLVRPAARPHPLVTENPLPGGHEKILFADDDPLVRDSSSRILAALGYEVVGTASGEEAVEYMQHNGADLIILDMRMGPGINGAETYRRIRELRPMQKAIVMTAYADPAEVAMVRALGIRHYLIKPALLSSLARAIREELDTP